MIPISQARTLLVTITSAAVLKDRGGWLGGTLISHTEQCRAHRESDSAASSRLDVRPQNVVSIFG
jgi:hypothetical protein